MCGQATKKPTEVRFKRLEQDNGEGRLNWGKVEFERPRVIAAYGLSLASVILPSWEARCTEDLLGKWALNLILIQYVSTTLLKFGGTVRNSIGRVPAPKSGGASQSA